MAIGLTSIPSTFFGGLADGIKDAKKISMAQQEINQRASTNLLAARRMGFKFDANGNIVPIDESEMTDQELASSRIWGELANYFQKSGNTASPPIPAALQSRADMPVAARPAPPTASNEWGLGKYDLQGPPWIGNDMDSVYAINPRRNGMAY